MNNTCCLFSRTIKKIEIPTIGFQWWRHHESAFAWYFKGKTHFARDISINRVYAWRLLHEILYRMVCIIAKCELRRRCRQYARIRAQVAGGRCRWRHERRERGVLMAKVHSERESAGSNKCKRGGKKGKGRYAKGVAVRGNECSFRKVHRRRACPERKRRRIKMDEWMRERRRKGDSEYVM